MFFAILAFMAASQAEAPQPEQTDGLATSVDAISTPPKLNRARAILCSCAKASPPQFMLQGLVIDAEMTLAPDGRSPADRQATIFKVQSATENGEKANTGDRVKIFHGADANACGVQFDYGKQYMVYAQKNEEGAYETDYCLMNAAFDVPSPDEQENREPSQAE